MHISPEGGERAHCPALPRWGQWVGCCNLQSETLGALAVGEAGDPIGGKSKGDRLSPRCIYHLRVNVQVVGSGLQLHRHARPRKALVGQMGASCPHAGQEVQCSQRSGTGQGSQNWALGGQAVAYAMGRIRPEGRVQVYSLALPETVLRAGQGAI